MKIVCGIIYSLCIILTAVTCNVSQSYILFFLLIPLLIVGVSDKQLHRIEPIHSALLDIAPRTHTFFQKRNVSPSLDYQPNLRSLEHDDRLRLTVDAFNTTLYLHLVQNTDIFHPNAVFHYQGQSVPIKASQFRVYQGYVIDEFFNNHWWISGLQDDMLYQPGVLGWARIVVRNDINVNGDIHTIKLTSNYYITKNNEDAQLQPHDVQPEMIIYRESDTTVNIKRDQTSTNGCGFDKLSHPTFVQRAYNPLGMMDTLSSPASQIKNPFSKRAFPEGCSNTKKILYMGVAADCTYTKNYGDSEKARMQIINDWNAVNNVYTEAINIAMGLINITIMDSGCPATPTPNAVWNRDCALTYSLEQKLSDFSRWRNTIGNDGAGLWHLMTNCASGSEVGIAWKDTVCAVEGSSQKGGFVSGTGVSSIIRDEWKVVAHEIGHNFGAMHDCTATTCPCTTGCDCCPFSASQCDAGGRYFMNPVNNASSDAFSPCSLSTMCSKLSSFQSCLFAPGTRKTTTLQMCGNGIKEEGEDCDSGGEDNACCNAATCKFKTGAVCDCQFRPSNYTCRAATNACDLPEVCPGTSGDCPPDIYEPDLKDCGNGLQCASGSCTSRDAQCAARGVDRGISRACGSHKSSCQVICQDGNSNFNCVAYPGAFVDGTPCGLGGTCKAGSCSMENFGNNAGEWIKKNLQIVIPVAIVVGLLLLFCIFRCCCYKRSSGYNTLESKYVITQPQGYPPQQPMPYYPPPNNYPPQNYPPNGNYPHTSTPPSGWVDPSLYNGPHDPQQPLPAYTPSRSTTPHNTDAYELSSANNWQNQGARSGTPPINAPSSPPPPANPHNRPHNEGVV
ncbi:Metallo-peptidase family M12-domain-containing protein [Pilobolus umbonatus]|nr:Metallo-peptidase family M12-domain-containing protein [Pilobolus umbonatus]